MKQLNSVYEKMVNALTVNLYRPMGGVNGNEEISAMEEYRRRTQKDDNA